MICFSLRYKRKTFHFPIGHWKRYRSFLYCFALVICYELVTGRFWSIFITIHKPSIVWFEEIKKLGNLSDLDFDFSHVFLFNADALVKLTWFLFFSYMFELSLSPRKKPDRSMQVFSWFADFPTWFSFQKLCSASIWKISPPARANRANSYLKTFLPLDRRSRQISSKIEWAEIEWHLRFYHLVPLQTRER